MSDSVYQLWLAIFRLLRLGLSLLVGFVCNKRIPFHDYNLKFSESGNPLLSKDGRNPECCSVSYVASNETITTIGYKWYRELENALYVVLKTPYHLTQRINQSYYERTHQSTELLSVDPEDGKTGALSSCLFVADFHIVRPV
jgi:hypothetical protein